jgi:hypothetical protein
MRPVRLTLLSAAVGAAAAPAASAKAAQLAVSVELPRMTVAEYHRPYVAMWIETPDQTAVKTLAVWYEVNKKGGEPATTWLKDMRQWWRRAGRSLEMPADGVSGPTRAPGRHQMVFGPAQLGGLKPGSYNLVVEAAREVGGREVVKAPFAWPPAGGGKTSTAKGASELGAVSVAVKP